ncbi:hypothetical protein AAG906_018951 [Vitis piasezkii]
MEALSQLSFRARCSDFILRFKVERRSGERRDVSHLLFVDDTLIFCKANSDQLRYLKTLENDALVMGCRVGKLPTSYLGLPLGAPFKSRRV